MDVLSEVVSKILEKVDEEVHKVKKAVEVLKERFEPKKVGNASKDFEWCAIDSAWQSPPVELVAKTVAVVYTGAYSNMDELNVVVVEPFVHDGSNFDVEVYWFSALKERKLAKELLLKGNLDVLIFDGTITPSPALASTPWKKVDEMMKVTEELVKVAERKGTTVVGVVKRAKAKYLATLADLTDVDISDKLLATLLLDYYEYIDLGTFEEMAYEYVTKRKHRTGEFLSRLANSANFVKEIREVYYRPLARHAVRVEILEYGPSVEEVVAFLMENTSPYTGFPIMLDFVDAFVSKNKVSTKTLERILENCIATRYRDPKEARIAYTLCGLQNPQKDYIYEK